MIAFDFLPRGRKYVATIYSDDPAATTATHVKREQKKVVASTVLPVSLAPSGGMAIWLSPEK
jgi:alpha-glucosidase